MLAFNLNDIRLHYEYRKIIRNINKILRGTVTLQETSELLQLPHAKACSRRGYIAKYKGLTIHLVSYYQHPVVVKGTVGSAGILLRINGFELTEATFNFEANDSNVPRRVNYITKVVGS